MTQRHRGGGNPLLCIIYSSDNSSTTGQWSLPWTSLQMSAFRIRLRRRWETMK